MTKDEFQREERYVVFKLSDIADYFYPSEISQLFRLSRTQQAQRAVNGKLPLECVVVESDWPEYEPTWKAIEARVMGAQPAPSVPTIEAAKAMGAKGGLVVEAERLAFEAWVRGHNWSLFATWNGNSYLGEREQGGAVCPHAMRTRMMWAAWRDRAALAPKAPLSVPREAIEKMLTQLMDIAVSNGANSISMPDEYVEVAAWLCGIPAQQAQNVPKAVAYLDLGTGGYMDIGTDLTDEALAALPKGRHMLGIVGTYGVDGYVPAQNAPSVPDGWLRAIDESLVVANIGVANPDDTYEQAKAKLDSLIGFHTDVATDPAVNGGWKLMPIAPTKEIYECFAAYDGTSYSNPFDFDDFRVDYAFAIEAAPEFKP